MTNTKLITATLAAVPFVCAVGVFAGIASADRSANEYSTDVQSQYADQKSSLPKVAPTNPRALPGLEAPKDRTDPEFESIVARKCAFAARLAINVYDDVTLRGMGRDDLNRLIITSAPEDKEAAKLHAKIVNYIGNLVFSRDYDYTKSQLSNHAYQYCDLVTHEYFYKGNGE